LEDLEAYHISRARSTVYALLYLALSTRIQDADRTPVDLLGTAFNACADHFEHLSRLRGVLARDCRKDLDAVTRSLIPRVLETWYENTGYTVEGEEPDSLAAMMAYMHKLAEGEAEAILSGDREKAYELRKIQLRFINTHIRPTIEALLREETDIKETLECLRDLIASDAEYLKEALTSQAFPHSQN